jgi:Protein of unknown function (DUF1360)
MPCWQLLGLHFTQEKVMSDCTSIVVGMFPIRTFLHLIYLSIACGAISMTLTKSSLLNGFHAWLDAKSPFLEKLLSCPWCTSHWVASVLTVIYQPLVFDWASRPAWQSSNALIALPLIALDYVVTIMVMVALSSVSARVIYSSYKQMNDK